MNLSDFKVLTFDCYGTLIDWESGIWDAFQPLLHVNGVSDITRADALKAFATIETDQEVVTPAMVYDDLLATVHSRFAAEYDLKTTAEMDRTFGDSVPYWPAFPDTADALRILKRYYKLVILSNVNRDGFAASNRRIGVTFDAIYTAQDVGTYKPNDANFDYLLKHLDQDHGIRKNEILHTAQSLHHDQVPANRAGLNRCWIDRQRLSDGGDWGATAKIGEDLPDPDFLFFTMAEMAAARAAEDS